MYFVSGKHRICHSERSEESAGARTHGPNGAFWAATHGRRGRQVGDRRARRPPTLTLSAGQRILRCAQNDKFSNIFGNIYFLDLSWHISTPGPHIHQQGRGRRGSTLLSEFLPCSVDSLKRGWDHGWCPASGRGAHPGPRGRRCAKAQDLLHWAGAGHNDRSGNDHERRISVPSGVLA